jgi:hypothetical protein
MLKCKAQLVARALKFDSHQGIDYKEAFSLVVQLNSIKNLLTLMATHKKNVSST